jgi:hypothetical protein
MSRVLFVALGEKQVMSRCLAEDVGISALERLPKGGVRLVCMSSEGAAIMARNLKSNLIAGEAVRELHRPRKTIW